MNSDIAKLSRMTQKRWHVVKGAMALSLATGSIASGQRGASSVQIGQVPSCQDCEVVLGRFARLTLPQQRFGTWPFVVTLSGRAEIVAGPSRDGGQFFVFDGSGAVRRVVVPKEAERFSYAELVFRGKGDSLIVLDNGRLRLTVLSPTWSEARHAPLPARITDAVVLPDGSMLASASIPTPDQFGYPLHLLRPGGTLERSFGAVPKTVKPFISKFRRMATNGDGTVWSARMDRYELEQWSPGGVLLRTLTAAPPWFPPWKVEKHATNVGPDADTMLRDIAFVNDSTLAVVFTVPRARIRTLGWWRESTMPRNTSDAASPDSSVYSCLQLLNVRRATVQAEAHFRESILGVTDGGKVFSRESEGASGETLSVWSIQLTHHRGAKP